MILAGDIGGTKTNLAYFRLDGGRLRPDGSTSYPSNDFGSLEEAVQKFRASFPGTITAAAFGVAGPVVDGRTEATNLSWIVDSRSVAKVLGLPQVGLINDLQATAYGVLQIGDEDKLVLNKGVHVKDGTIGIIAAGTGLGQGALVWDGRRYHAMASEGGHSDFAPRSDTEIEILRFLKRDLARVSYERVVSGPGLGNLYRFFRSKAGYPEPDWLTKAMADADPPAVISDAALQGKDPACVEALETFVSLYGAETGNIALKFLATGGVFVGGGIAPKIIARLREGSFMKAFLEKGRYSPLLSQMPVAVVLNDKTALYGAAHYALMLQTGSLIL
jgi:glucokinase